MKYTEQAVETLDDAGSVIANKNIEIEQLHQRVAELTAERDEYKGKLEDEIVDHDCHRTELTAWATKYREAITERDALKQQRDELLAALERSLESFEYIAKYGNSCGHSQLRIPDLKAAIASVKEKA